MERLLQTNEIYGLEIFARVADMAALGEQLGGEKIALFIDINAVAGALIKESSKVPIVLALVESSRGSVEQLPASCW